MDKKLNYQGIKRRVVPMTAKEIRNLTGLSQHKFADATGIPFRTIQNWENGVSSPGDYVLNLLQYYVEHELVSKER